MWCFVPGVAERQFASAAPATDQPGEERIAVLGRAMMPAGGNVAADHLADRLRLLPADIAFMGIRHQRQPFGPRLAPALLAPARTIAHRGRGLTIGIGAAVDRVLDHPVDGRIVRPPPGHIPAVPLCRQVQPMLMEPEQGLPRAAELGNLVEDQRDRLPARGDQDPSRSGRPPSRSRPGQRR